MQLDVAALDARVLVEPPARHAEGLGDRHVDVLVRFIGDRKRAPRDAQLERDAEAFAAAVAAMRELDDDVTAFDAVVRVIELRDPARDMRFDGRACRHGTECQIESCCHTALRCTGRATRIRPMREARLSLIILAVEDRARALRFYRDVFDWTLAVDAPTYAELALPEGMRLGIYDRRGFGTNFGRELSPAA